MEWTGGFRIVKYTNEGAPGDLARSNGGATRDFLMVGKKKTKTPE